MLCWKYARHQKDLIPVKKKKRFNSDKFEKLAVKVQKILKEEENYLRQEREGQHENFYPTGFPFSY